MPDKLFLFKMETTVSQTIDHLFRHEYGRIVSGLTSKFGSEHIELVEDAVQESLLKAMKLWGFGSMPDNPTSWLYMVARNKMIDLLRRSNKSQSFTLELSETEDDPELSLESEIEDEQLKMIFACCNPAIQSRDSLLLSLKLIGGFSVAEIARALLLKEEAAKKSLQRAKAKFREEVKALYVPTGKELKLYNQRVLKVVYLIFNEGYKSSGGEELIKQDLCGEALRLALLLSRKENCKSSEVYSLISLMSFKIARFNARIVDGELVTLKNQDRSKWIPEYIEWAYYYYHQATLQKQINSYYLEASIEFKFHIAKSYDEIDWLVILDIYKHLMLENSSPLIQLNRLVALSKVEGPKLALMELAELESRLSNHHLYFALKSDLEAELNFTGKAMTSLEKAITLCKNEVEKNYMLKKLKNLEATLL